jgi:hypothetical protein
MSPHAHNEMITPYVYPAEHYELGGACAFNSWRHQYMEEVNYIKTYPDVSFSVFINGAYAWNRFSIIGGLEWIGFPIEWSLADHSGFYMWIKPDVGFQWSTRIVTCRYVLAPLVITGRFGPETWPQLEPLSYFTKNLFTLLFHNPAPARILLCGGVRFAPMSNAVVLGYQHDVTDQLCFRAEYSNISGGGLGSEVAGTLNYLTAGLFWQMK